MFHARGDDMSPAESVPKIAMFSASVQFFVKITRSNPQPLKYSSRALRQFCTTAAQARESLCPLLPGFAHSFTAEVTAEITASGLRPPVAALSK